MAAQTISPEQMSIAQVKEVFDAAYMDTSMTDNNQVQITEGGIKLFVSVDADKQLVQYLMLFGFKPRTKEQDQLKLVNDINSNLVFVRAWSFGNGVALDYSLPYDGGLPPKQVISAYRWLRKTALAGLQQFDQKGILS